MTIVTLLSTVQTPDVITKLDHDEYANQQKQPVVTVLIMMEMGKQTVMTQIVAQATLVLRRQDLAKYVTTIKMMIVMEKQTVKTVIVLQTAPVKQDDETADEKYVITD